MTQGEDLDVPRVVEDIAVRVRITALFTLAIGLVLLCTFFAVIAQEGLGDLRGVASMLCGVSFAFVAAGFFAILARDFRARKWWTFDIVEVLTWNFWLYPKRLRDGIRDERMRRAFGLEDEYDYSPQSNPRAEFEEQPKDH